MAEKNVAALLDESAFTIQVQFKLAQHENTYTYVCNDPSVKVFDNVVVGTGPNDTPKVATVVAVSKTVDIPPNSDIEFKWVMFVLNFDQYRALMARNAQVQAAVANAYKHNLRNQHGSQPLTMRVMIFINY